MMRASCSTPCPTNRCRPKSAFVAAKSQFTPKEVETRDERQKLVFRVKLRLTQPSAVPQAKPGMPGAGYVRTHRRLAGQPAMNGLALQANGIAHRYGKQQALIDIAFSLPAGTRCGLIGPDGAGKSSLLGLIAGVKTLQQGQLEVLGGSIQDRRHRNSLYPRIAFMPQGLGGNLYPELSISENIRFFATLFGLSKANASSACTACCWPPTCCASPSARPASCLAA
jgi:ABC-type multidrug transport system fused ATPase/permease subunit